MGAAGGKHHRPHDGKSHDWITPPVILNALGPFDLDPCACIPQPWPCASKSYTIRDNGLIQPWRGRVWLNPPYGPKVGEWLSKMARHGRGIALIFARTSTQVWFNHVWKESSGILFLNGYQYFHFPDGTRSKDNAGAASVLVSYGAGDREILRTCGLDGVIIDSWRFTK